MTHHPEFVHYALHAADAWEIRAKAAEARADRLQTALDEARRQGGQCLSHCCPHCGRPAGSQVPGDGFIAPPPGTRLFTASGDAPR